MLIKYKGGRSHYKVSLNRKFYYFTKENNHTCDIKDHDVINYIFSLPNNSEFEAVMQENQRTIPPQSTLNNEPIKEIEEKKKSRGRPKKRRE